MDLMIQIGIPTMVAVFSGVGFIWYHRIMQATIKKQEATIKDLELKLHAQPTNIDVSPPKNKIEEEIKPITKRIMLLCSTTKDIENSTEKTDALKRFYGKLILEIERTPYGINTCGAEPLRTILIEHYCKKLFFYSKAQIDKINDKVRWYWFSPDTVGFNHKPPVYNSYETDGMVERTIKELADSDIIVAFTGGMGVREQVDRILEYHNNGLHGVDINRKLLVILGWFGGTAQEILTEVPNKVANFMNTYSELNPIGEVKDWEKGDMPEILAKKLVAKLRNSLV